MFCVLSTDVYFSLNDDVIPNHGYVVISDIGGYTDALVCRTNHPQTRSGNWFAPDGARVRSVPGFTASTVSAAVRLWRTSGTPPEGIYWCSILDAASTLQTVYVGLYNSGGGEYRVFNILSLL